MDQVMVQQQPFDPNEEIASLTAADASQGAVVSFIGLMRDFNEGDEVSSMTLEHYPGMTEKALQAIVVEAHERWQVGHVKVIHRVGELNPTDPIVLVAVSSEHRGDAFRACEFLIDYLKTKAPFWKKENTATGERWVEERASDAEAEKRWEEPGD